MTTMERNNGNSQRGFVCRRLDPMDERRQLDYSHLERAVYDFFDLRKIGLMRNKDVDVIPRPKDVKIAPIDWNNTKTEYKNL